MDSQNSFPEALQIWRKSEQTFLWKGFWWERLSGILNSDWPIAALSGQMFLYNDHYILFDQCLWHYCDSYYMSLSFLATPKSWVCMKSLLQKKPLQGETRLLFGLILWWWLARWLIITSWFKYSYTVFIAFFNIHLWFLCHFQFTKNVVMYKLNIFILQETIIKFVISTSLSLYSRFLSYFGSVLTNSVVKV